MSDMTSDFFSLLLFQTYKEQMEKLREKALLNNELVSLDFYEYRLRMYSRSYLQVRELEVQNTWNLHDCGKGLNDKSSLNLAPTLLAFALCSLCYTTRIHMQIKKW